MHTITIGGLDRRRPERDQEFRFPGAWNECTPLQLGMTVAMLNMPLPAADDPEVLADFEAMRRMQLLCDLSGMPASVAKRLRDAGSFVFVADDHGAILPQLDWAFTEMLWPRTLVPELITQERTGHWLTRRITWIGPQDGLINFTVKQWGYADNCLQRVLREPKPEHLHNLLGAIYVPEGVAWDADGVERRGVRLSGLPQHLKLAALANYKAIRSWLPKRYKNAFAGGAEDANGVHGLIVDLAGPKFGTTIEAERAPLHDVLIYVDKAKRDAIEREGKIVVPEGYVNKFKGEA